VVGYSTFSAYSDGVEFKGVWFSITPQINFCSYMDIISLSQGVRGVAVAVLSIGAIAHAQQAAPRPREFPPGMMNRIEDLPASRLRTRLDGLPAAARGRALEWLRSFHFTESDLDSLDADAEGGIFYADKFSIEAAADPVATEPVVAQAAVAVNPFPASLVYHSKPGSPNVLFLNFAGENVSGTSWNNSVGRTLIAAVPFSTDNDFSNFSDAEQLAIKRIWQRVSEDYAPFDIDVTTERPATFGPRTAHAVITRTTDANNQANPSSSAGGVAYVNVFGASGYASYRPAWIYFNNLGNSESYIAEATTHEIGHNLGLSHDGKTSGTEYYSGHGSGDTSWAPIMGSSYNRNVTQWSKGEYYLANNTQDDLAIIAGKLPYRNDDHGNTSTAATPLVITGNTNVISTTPETDPKNLTPANKGVLERNTDVDVFSFTTGNGPVKLTVNPWIEPSGTRGGNVDLLLELRSASGALIQTNNPGAQTLAQIQTTLTAGTYYLHIRSASVGTPSASTPSGYTAYASIGQYFISGAIASPVASSPVVQLLATVNNPAWGAVSPSNAMYSPGSTVQVLATPALYYRFDCWTNGATGTNDPLTLVLNTNLSIQAVFRELLTTNYSIPYSWLAAHGYASNFETAVMATGANGLPLWQSYQAGLNPNDPASQLRLSLTRGANGTANVLNWNTVSGRVYSLWWSTNLANGFVPLPGATNLPATTQSFTHTLSSGTRAAFYRLAARQL
jgi:hypothetical protein